ncbi:MAG: carbohydrate kinase family protein [Acidimicrobiales bacterium]|nr:carbohydrate kinase family protein [Acidimicrobiales bacterium]
MLVCVGDLVEEVLVQLRTDPRRGGDIPVRAARVRGGSAANVAAITAEQGSDVRFVGQVGDDHVGRTLTEDLERRGVDLRVAFAGGTGVIITMIGRGGRSRMIDRGASRRLSRLDPACLDGAEQLYLAASAVTDDPLATAVDRLLGEATERRVPVTLSGPTLAELESFGTDPFLELCRTLEPAHVILNRAEHHALDLRARSGIDGAATTVVTNGRRPTLVIDRSGTTSVEVPPLDDVLDRTGVGDGFIAGFLRSRRSGADPASAAHAGHRVAASVLRNFGPTATAP